MMEKTEMTIKEMTGIFEGATTPEEILQAKLTAQTATAIINERLRRGETQAEFAATLHTQQPRLAIWEKGYFNFTLRKISEIAAAMDMDVNISFARKEDANEKN